MTDSLGMRTTIKKCKFYVLNTKKTSFTRNPQTLKFRKARLICLMNKKKRNKAKKKQLMNTFCFNETHNTKMVITDICI